MSAQIKAASSLFSVKRYVFGRYYQVGNVYRVFFGPLRGVCLFYDGQISYREMLGLYDRENFEILSKIFINGGICKPGMVLADVGANVGLYSIFLSKLLSGRIDIRIYAFEPNPAAANLLERHLELNHIANAKVIKSGLSNKVGIGQFYLGAFHKTSSLIPSHGNGTKEVHYNTSPISIPLTTFDDFFVKGGREVPDFIKLDIEGAGEFALTQINECLSRKHPVFFVESHNPKEDNAIGALVNKWGYSAYRINDHRWVANPKLVYPHPDGIWGNMILAPSSLKSRFLEILPSRP